MYSSIVLHVMCASMLMTVNIMAVSIRLTRTDSCVCSLCHTYPSCSAFPQRLHTTIRPFQGVLCNSGSRERAGNTRLQKLT